MDWHEPNSVSDALRLAAELGEDGKFLAGGTWVALVLKQGLLVPDALISLHGIDGLNTVEYGADGLRIGAMVTLREMERNSTIKQFYPELAYVCGVVANVRIRNQATVGGCLCDADYASDPPSMFAALSARVVLQSETGTREVPVRDFIVGHYTTTIDPSEMLTSILVPKRPETARGTYLKFRSRSHEDRPCVGVSAVADLDGGICRSLSVVIGAVADTPQIVDGAAALAIGKRLDSGLIKQIANGYADSIEPLSDIRGSSWYRQQMINVHVKRALTEIGQIGGVA